MTRAAERIWGGGGGGVAGQIQKSGAPKYQPVPYEKRFECLASLFNALELSHLSASTEPIFKTNCTN